MAMMLAIVEAAKRVLEGIPNVELVTLLFVVFAVAYGLRTLIVAVAFVAVEICFWGVHVWVIMYLYVWPLLILLAWRMGRKYPPWAFALMTGFYGLLFGLLCSPVYLFMGGFNTAFSWWVAGIPYDIPHGISNFVLCLILFKPLLAATDEALKRIGRP